MPVTANPPSPATTPTVPAAAGKAPTAFEAPSAADFGLTAFAFFVIVTGGGLPTPLYVIYQHEWGFSPAILTVIFAAYAAGLVAMLLLFGRLSDRFGRRPVLLLAIGVALASTVVFLLATNVEWLLLGRVLSGMSVGLCANTATAALTEFEPRGDRNRAALVVAVLTGLGVGIGPLYAGVLAQYAPDPLTLSFWVLLGLLVASLGAVLAIRERARPRAPASGALRHLIRVPADLRPIFALSGLAAFLGFSLAGIFSGLSPSFLADDLKITNHAISGLVVILMFGVGSIAPILLHRVPHHRMMRVGAACVPLGLLGITYAVWTASATAFLLGTVICGIGFGLALRGGIGLLNRAAPPEERAGVLSAFYVAAYLGLSVPVIGIGVLANVVGLPTAALVLAVIISLLSLRLLLSQRLPSAVEAAPPASLPESAERPEEAAPRGLS